MSRYRMDDGTIVDTENAKKHWDEATYWDGHNRCSVPTGSQWDHEALHVSRKGRYYIEHWSQYEGLRPWAEWVSNERAAAWLLQNEHDVPTDLAEAADTISE